MKITNNFIEGFVTECYAKGLTEKQASWLLDRYIAEGNGEIMEKSAAGKSIINLLLMLLALGAGAYGIDHLGGTNTALGKWLKNTLGAGNWGIKDALTGLFTPTAKPAVNTADAVTATPSVPAVTPQPSAPAVTPQPSTPAITVEQAKNTAKRFGKGVNALVENLKEWAASRSAAKELKGNAEPPTVTAAPPAPKVPIAQLPKAQPVEASDLPDLNLPDMSAIDSKDGAGVTALQNFAEGNGNSGIGAELRNMLQRSKSKLINMAGKPTQVQATPPTPKIDVASLPKAPLVAPLSLPELNLPAMPEADNTGSGIVTPAADINTPKARRLHARALSELRAKDEMQDARKMYTGGLDIPAMNIGDPLEGEAPQQAGVDYDANIKDLQGNLHYYEMERRNAEANAKLKRHQKWNPFYEDYEPLEMKQEDIDLPKAKSLYVTSDNSLELPKPEAANQNEWLNYAEPLDIKKIEEDTRPAIYRHKTWRDHLLNAVRNAPTYHY